MADENARPSIGTSSSAARRWVHRLFPVALIIVAFALLEGAARLAIWYRYGSADFRIQETLDYAPFVLTAEKDAVYSFTPKPEGVIRVMILGSSTARQIPLETWKEVFIDREVSRVEIINCAQGGYTSTQELLYFLLYGMNARPDVVVTLDGINDIVALTKSGRPGIPYINKTIERALNRPAFFWLERVFRRSQLVNAVRKLHERRLEVAVQSDAASNAGMTAVYRANMEKVAVLCAGIGATHIAILQPYIHLRRVPPPAEQKLGKNYLYRKKYMSAEMQHLREAMRSSRLLPPAIYIDGNDAFDASPETTCFRDEAHLTPEGAQLLIRAIRERIARAPIKKDE